MNIVYRIGRSGANDIVLADSSVSRVHAELHVEADGRFSLVDLSSTNGTFVRDKGRWVEVETAHVEHGERVLIGDVVTTVTALLHQAEARHADARKLAVGDRPAPLPFRPQGAPPRPATHLPPPNGDSGARPIIFGDSRPQREATAIGRNRTAIRTPDPSPEPKPPTPAERPPAETKRPLVSGAESVAPPAAPKPVAPFPIRPLTERAMTVPDAEASAVTPVALAAPTDRSLVATPPPLSFDRDAHGRRRQILLWTTIALVLTATAAGATYAYLDWRKAPPVVAAKTPTAKIPPAKTPAKPATPATTKTPTQTTLPTPVDPRGDAKPYADPTLPKTPTATDPAKPAEPPAAARSPGWEKLLGGKGDDVFHSVAVARDNGYLAVGTTNSRGQGQFDIWVVRFDADGRVLWDKTFGGKRNDYAVSAKATADGGFVVAGTTESQDDGKPRMWLMKLSAKGIVEWERTLGMRKSESADAVIATLDGGYAVVSLSMDDEAPQIGARLTKLDAKGKEDWTQLYGKGRTWPSDLRQTFDGGYVLVGTSDAKSDGRLSLWALRLDSTGRKLWERQYPGKDNDAKPRLRLGDGRDYWIVANTEPLGARPAGAAPGNIRIVRFNDAGDKTWDHVHAKAGAERVKGFLLTPKGMIIAGSTNIGAAGKDELFLLKLDHAGKLQWERKYGGPGADLATDLQPTRDGHMIVVGRTDSRGQGRLDGWIMRLDAEGRM